MAASWASMAATKRATGSAKFQGREILGLKPRRPEPHPPAPR